MQSRLYEINVCMYAVTMSFILRERACPPRRVKRRRKTLPFSTSGRRGRTSYSRSSYSRSKCFEKAALGNGCVLICNRHLRFDGRFNSTANMNKLR